MPRTLDKALRQQAREQHAQVVTRYHKATGNIRKVLLSRANRNQTALNAVAHHQHQKAKKKSPRVPIHLRKTRNRKRAQKTLQQRKTARAHNARNA